MLLESLVLEKRWRSHKDQQSQSPQTVSISYYNK